MSVPDQFWISWKVLTERCGGLEDDGYVGHKEIPRLPRVTRYWLTLPGCQSVSTLCLLDAWYRELEPGLGSTEQSGRKIHEKPADDQASYAGIGQL